MTATWRGPVELVILRKKEISWLSDDQADVTITYEGEKSALLARGYRAGQLLIGDDIPANCYISQVKLSTGEQGPKCVLTVTATTQNSTGSSSGSASDTIYELDWERIEKDIRTHRAFYNLSEADLNKVNQWQNETDAAKKAALYAALAGTNNSGAKGLAFRLARNQTTYPIWVPVARKSWFASNNTGGAPVGAINSPPTQCHAPSSTANGKSYIYVKMADKSTKSSGKPWRREQVWYGFDEIDSLIYQNK